MIKDVIKIVIGTEEENLSQVCLQHSLLVILPVILLHFLEYEIISRVVPNKPTIADENKPV